MFFIEVSVLLVLIAASVARSAPYHVVLNRDSLADPSLDHLKELNNAWNAMEEQEGDLDQFQLSRSLEGVLRSYASRRFPPNDDGHDLQERGEEGGGHGASTCEQAQKEADAVCFQDSNQHNVLLCQHYIDMEEIACQGS